MWQIEKIIKKGDYLYCIVRDHPNRSKKDYVLHHRVIVENSIGRLLTKNEVVHHINGDKKDNRIDNLELMSKIEHAKHHGSECKRKYVKLICPHCLCEFERPHNKTFLAKKGKYTTCSPSCRGSFSRRIQLNGECDEVLKLISNNVVEIFYK